MSNPRAVLIGLPSKHSMIPGDMQPAIAKALASVGPLMADAGVEYEFFAVTPGESLSALGPRLQAYRPDVVVIGNGIRREMDLTPFMEQIIDVVRTSVPQAKLGFNTNPGNTVEVVKRLVPTAAAAKSA